MRHRLVRPILILALLAAATACGAPSMSSSGPHQRAQAPPATAVTLLPSQNPASACHERPAADGTDVLPDPHCTPGAIDPAVTQDNINSTICVRGYTSRPGVRNVPYAERKKVLASYGLTPTTFHGELDHLVSLELGGSNDPTNLWPEPDPSPNDKDGTESHLHSLVCTHHTMDLPTAQNILETDWTKGKK